MSDGGGSYWNSLSEGNISELKPNTPILWKNLSDLYPPLEQYL